ncbi:MAG TPA: replication-associated recombination protein A, partial [Limnochordia bacterium]|nr:replication-associated recombination protein A [Limnochordia bacterium]
MSESVDLFSQAESESAQRPLAARMRPRDLDEFVGQGHILGPGKVLRRMIEADNMGSIVLYGPPGTGKTTLARIIAGRTKARFVRLVATETGVAEIKRILSEAEDARRFHRRRTLLFIDEVQHLSKSQQNVLLAAVEDGAVSLIAATTENPYFEVNAALLSRSRIFTFEPLEDADVAQVIERAMADAERGLGARRLTLDEAARGHLVQAAAGDARTALGALEMAALALPEGERTITLAIVEDALQKHMVRYDKAGDAHYDVISAFIKALRGSDVDAALYWLGRMLDAGEDPRFIVRRLIVHASEDVGLADPQAMLMAHAAANALEWVGLPEARIPIAQATIYIAQAPKSNSVVCAIDAAIADAHAHPDPVPVHLRDTHYPGAKRLGHGAGYQYPHDFPDHHVVQAYRPPSAAAARYYEPSSQGFERDVAARQRARWGP